MAFTPLDALREGYEVHPIADAAHNGVPTAQAKAGQPGHQGDPP